MDPKKRNRIIATVLLAVAVILLGVQIFRSFSEKKAEDVYQELAEETKVEKPAQESAEKPGEDEVAEPSSEEEAAPDWYSEHGIEVPDKEVDFDHLTADVNADIYAWIYIPGTQVDYPMVQHPTDDSHYLDYNLDGSKGYPGGIYTEKANAKDFSDPVTVVYGHNMKNGTAFGSLKSFRDADFFAEHKYIYVYTPEKLLVYEIYAAYENDDNHILLGHDYTDFGQYDSLLHKPEYIRTMNKVIREDTDLDAAEHLLFLSTCISNKPNNRYLVMGVLLNEEMD